MGWTAPPGVVGTKYGLYWASGSFISQNFDQQSIGSGTADGKTSGGTIQALTELAAFSNGADPSGTIRSARHRLTGDLVIRYHGLD